MAGLRRRFSPRWSIARALVVVVLVVLAPSIALETYRGVQDTARQRSAVAKDAQSQAREKADSMDDFLRQTERDLATLASLPSVQALDADQAGGIFQVWRRQHPTYENIFLVKTDGTQVASTEPLVDDFRITERPYFKNALATSRMTISGVLTWPGTGKAVVVLAYPVIAPGNTQIGVVAVALDIGRLNAVIGYVGGKDTIVLLVQGDGAVIAASADPKMWVGQTLAGTDLYQKIAEHQSRLGVNRMLDGMTRVIGAEGLTRADWVMLAGIPRTEVDAAVRESLGRIAQQLALVAIATAVLAYIVLRRVVVPIRVLSEGARAFAAGYLNRRIPLRRNDELGDLAAALNAMAESLERRLQEESSHAAALRELNQLQAEFVATASHELRTPVTSIRSYTEALLRPDIVDEETRRECLEGIDRGSDRLARLVRTLLDVSRIDSGRVQVALGPVDVAAAARAAAESGRQAPGRIIVDVPRGLPPVLADPDRLEDVLGNLVANAQKFSPPDAPVTVTARQEGGEIILAVRDRGSGIPEQELGRIFDRFYQVNRGADRQAGGSGLGLYITRGYVTAMGGRLWAESTPGEGSTFFVALPVAVPPGATNEQEEIDAALAGAARG